MRQTLNDILGGLALAPFAALTMYCFLAEDPMQVEIGRAAEAEAQVDEAVRVRECAHDTLRHVRGEPTAAQVEAAYRGCRR